MLAIVRAKPLDLDCGPSRAMMLGDCQGAIGYTAELNAGLTLPTYAVIPVHFFEVRTDDLGRKKAVSQPPPYPDVSNAGMT